MTTITLPRATVEQALEAMLNFPDDISDAMFESITALKAALAQKHDPVAHSGWVLREVLFDNGEPIGHREPQHSPAALAHQAEPVEPVAWRSENANPPGGYVIFQQYPQALADLGKPIQPLYTAPPQRKLVPLTEEEIDKIFKHLCDTVGASCKTMARAVEKASWEKNHGQA